MIKTWSDIMVDVETTGTDVSTAGIIQISAIFFDLKTKEIGPAFDKCLALPQTTGVNFHWDLKTYNWWHRDEDRRAVLESIKARQEYPRDVIDYFIRWVRVNGNGKSLHFWSKPSHFDYPLLDKYFRFYQYENPFIYWKARDMRSFILAKTYPNPLPDLKFNSSEAHNALKDVEFQIKELFKYI